VSRDRLLDERGDTLLELIIAVSILGIAFVALLTAMFTSNVSSDLHRKQAVAGGELRNFSEAIQRETYVSCATVSSYGSTYTAPTGFTKSITAIEFHNADATNPAVSIFQGTCPSTDQGIQRLTLRIASTDARITEDLVVVKRCAGARPSPCP